MPTGLAGRHVACWFDAKKAENKVFLGAFYAVDPKSDPADARRLWNEAAAAGVDVKSLLPLLDPEPADAGAPTTAADLLIAVPGPRLIDRAEQRIKDEFADAYAAAANDGKRVELANRLLAAVDAAQAAPRRYVLLREARDLAMQAGHPQLMADAVDRMARLFRIDALDMKTDLLAAHSPDGLPAARETVRVALALIDEAQDAKRLSVASRLAQIAVSAAQMAESSELLKRATQRNQQIDKLLKDSNSKTSL